MRRKAQGLTLIELMVTLAVLVVMLTMGVPAFAGLHERTRVATTYHQLTTSLMSARSTAITTRQPVTLCPSSDGQQCREDLAWEHGWIMFADPARTGVPASGDSVLRHTGPVGGTLSVRSSQGRPRVRYLPNGRAHGSNLTLRICSAEERLLGKVVVNNTGRARTERSNGKAACA